MYGMYVREAVERGLVDSEEGLTKDVAEVRTKYGPKGTYV